jgi:hypothetical protein
MDLDLKFLLCLHDVQRDKCNFISLLEWPKHKGKITSASIKNTALTISEPQGAAILDRF